MYNYEPPILPCRRCQTGPQIYANVYYVNEHTRETFRKYYVECPICYIYGKKTREYDTKLEALRVWNKLYGFYKLALVKVDKDDINGADS